MPARNGFLLLLKQLFILIFHSSWHTLHGKRADLVFYLSGAFMGKRGKKRNTDVRILGDHKKVGKTLVPPMRQYLGEQGMVSWADRFSPS